MRTCVNVPPNGERRKRTAHWRRRKRGLSKYKYVDVLSIRSKLLRFASVTPWCVQNGAVVLHSCDCAHDTYSTWSLFFLIIYLFVCLFFITSMQKLDAFDRCSCLILRTPRLFMLVFSKTFLKDKKVIRLILIKYVRDFTR